MLARTFAFLEPFVASSRPSRLVLVRRFLVALDRALRNNSEREGACVVAGNVFGLPSVVLSASATSGPDAVDSFLERALFERLEAAPEGLDARADWLVRWGPLVEALVPEGPHGASPVPEMVTLAPELAALFARLPELARSSLSLMIEGESGTGRESFARVVHAAHRLPRPFVVWDCEQTPHADAERVLFGHPLAPGLIARAGDGSLLIRNAESLATSVQHRLARCLELQRVVDALGRPEGPLHCRFIFCVSDGSLASTGPGVGTLHPDFAWRASSLYTRLPPLAERDEDLEALYRNVVRRFVLERPLPLSPEEMAREPRMTLTPRALLALYAYRWPGNVSEFVAVVREARQRASAGPLELSHLPERVVAALGRPGNQPADHLRRQLVRIAPASISSPEQLTAARRRLREWRDRQLDQTLGRETLELIARAIAGFNALREGTHDPMPWEGALAQVRAASAREILIPTGSTVPLFADERVELVAELEAVATAQTLPGSLARRLTDLGRALVLYPTQARDQLQPRVVDNEQRPSAVAMALVAAAR